MTDITDFARRMAHSRLANYIIPGLTSSLIGGDGYGTVRLFECSRNHEETIVPHSHRFDFRCLVLAGRVVNTVWKEGPDGDPFMQTILSYDGAPGQYRSEDSEVAHFIPERTTYVEGDWYGMPWDEIHSIKFSKGAVVLFLEGPLKSNSTIILQPFVDGEVVPTMKVEPWMFRTTEAQ